MWMFISGASFGVIAGFIMCGLIASGKRDDECRQCPAVNVRDIDIRALTRSRDLFRDKAEQAEELVTSLRIKIGIKNHKEGQEFYKRLGVAG